MRASVGLTDHYHRMHIYMHVCVYTSVSRDDVMGTNRSDCSDRGETKIVRIGLSAPKSDTYVMLLFDQNAPTGSAVARDK